jgi:hypothetical protein
MNGPAAGLHELSTDRPPRTLAIGDLARPGPGLSAIKTTRRNRITFTTGAIRVESGRRDVTLPRSRGITHR